MSQAVKLDINNRIEAFKASLSEGAEFALSEHLKHQCSIVGPEMELGVRETVAAEFGVSVDEVWLVGSAKLGFSPKPGQYFKHFSDRSDIDVALVSSELYAEIWREVYQMDLAGEYYDKDKFTHYHLRGWIRPDALPSSSEYGRCRTWWNFFRTLSAKEEFMRMKIRGGLYHDLHFLRHYQLTGLLAMREHVMEKKA